MYDIFGSLRPTDRAKLERMAAGAQVSPDDMAAGFIAAYLQLANDAPGALPRDPMRGPVVAAQAAARRRGGAA
jgi:hypothetical protein